MLEAISLAYIELEIELRFLLSTNVGTIGAPIQKNKIDGCQYLSALAQLAKDEGFINDSIFDRIKEFNAIRRKAIHGLAQGKISYGDLREPVENIFKLIEDIQGCWLKLTFGFSGDKTQ